MELEVEGVGRHVATSEQKNAKRNRRRSFCVYLKQKKGKQAPQMPHINSDDAKHPERSIVKDGSQALPRQAVLFRRKACTTNKTSTHDREALQGTHDRNHLTKRRPKRY
jgi:hypothetical protein